jgi:LAS superfamily LD-carboxypeptidase LdcB
VRLRTLPRHAALGVAATITALLGGLAVSAAAAPEPAAPPLAPVAAEPAQRDALAQHASRRRDARAVPEVDPLPGCGADAAVTSPNGQLPETALCALPAHVDHKLRPAAARDLVRLGQAYEEWFGSPLCVTDSYRSLGSQQALAVRKPGLAAVPGTSEHGWGLAVDLGCGVEGYDTPEHRWMIANAGRFGWGQPDWAKDGGAREEPWHWEHLASAPTAP